MSELHLQDPLDANIEISKQVLFKLDTGADVSVISTSLSKSLGLRVKKTNRELFVPNRTRLMVDGVSTVSISRTTVEDIYSLPDQRTPLLSRRAILQLGLIKLNIHAIEDQIFQEFPEVFLKQGLGKLNGEYKISLMEAAVPFAVAAPRRVSVPLMPKVKVELDVCSGCYRVYTRAYRLVLSYCSCA